MFYFSYKILTLGSFKVEGTTNRTVAAAATAAAATTTTTKTKHF